MIQTWLGADLGLIPGLHDRLPRTEAYEVTATGWTAILLGTKGDQEVLQETDFVIAARPRGKFQPQAAGALGIAQLPEQPDTNRKAMSAPAAAKRVDTDYAAQPLRPVGVARPPDLFTATVGTLKARYVH
jgi:hypothetical protein